MAHRLKQHPGTLGVVFPSVTARIAQAFPSVRRACVVALGNTDVYPDYSIHYTEPAYFAPHARAIAAHCDLTDAAVETLRTRGFSTPSAQPTWRSRRRPQDCGAQHRSLLD